MKNTRLYIVEGLPCSGKSSTAKFIAEKTGGTQFDEGCGDHPADWEFHAFIPDTAAEFTALERAELDILSERLPGGIVVPLNAVSGALADKAMKYKIYDCLEWEAERPVMLAKWRRFAENARKDSLYVFNCVLLQNPMCETMMRFDLSPEQSLCYIREICDIISPLEPVIVYLRNSDIETSIKAALSERGQDWLNAVVDYHCSGGYGMANGLSGFDGYIRALEERQRRELSFLPQLPVRSVVIDDPQKDWHSALQRISDIISAN